MSENLESSDPLDAEVMEHLVDDSSRPGGEMAIEIPETGIAGCPTAPSSLSVSVTIDATATTTPLSSASPADTIVDNFIPLTRFTYFPRLPYELRHMIFTIAIIDSAPRILGIQPQYREHPALMQTCTQSRSACTKFYHYCASRQRCKKFRFFIDYQKDVLYLNYPFTLYGGRAQLSVLQATHSIYPEFLQLIETMAMNLREVRNLSGDHRGKNTLWLMLSNWCPNLKELRIVINNFPANGLFLDFVPIKTSEEFKAMVPPPKDRHMEEISQSWRKAKSEHKQCLDLRMRLVHIDEKARKVLTKKKKDRMVTEWKEANEKIDGYAEVDRLGGPEGPHAAFISANMDRLEMLRKSKKGFMLGQKAKEEMKLKKDSGGSLPKKPAPKAKTKYARKRKWKWKWKWKSKE